MNNNKIKKFIKEVFIIFLLCFFIGGSIILLRELIFPRIGNNEFTIETSIIVFFASIGYRAYKIFIKNDF